MSVSHINVPLTRSLPKQSLSDSSPVLELPLSSPPFYKVHSPTLYSSPPASPVQFPVFGPSLTPASWTHS